MKSCREILQHLLPILHSRMKMINFRILLLPLLLGLSCSAFAQQVYKSTDAEGNVTFSDTPSTGSEAVQVEETNVEEAVKVPKNQFEDEAPAPKPKVTQQAPPQPTPEPTVETDDDDYYVPAPRIIRRHHHPHLRRR